MKTNFDIIIPRENTSCVKYDLREMFFKNPDVIPMWVADMDFKTPNFIIDAIKERLNHEILGYTFRSDAYHQSIIDWMQSRHQWNIKREWIGFSPGVVPALSLVVLAYTNEGDGIVVQPPVYFPFFPTVEDHKRKLIYNELSYVNGKYEIDFDDLDEKLKKAKAFMFCNPHNPVCRVWTEEELRRVGDLCLKYDVLIFSDEIHSDLIMPGFKHIPMASLSGEISNKTITFMAPSKTFNLAGLSTSFLIIEDTELKKKYDKMLDNFHLGSGNLFGNVALEAAYNNGAEWVDELNEYLYNNYLFVKRFLETELPQIKLIEAEATYLLWMDFSLIGKKEDELKDILINKANLGYNHGSMFGPGGNGFFRMNTACPRSVIEKALNQLKEVFV
jgi:cystathionine beta-lyase